MPDQIVPIIPNAVYKPREAAAVLRVDKSVIYQAIKSGKLESREIGRGYKILGESLLFFAGSQTYGSAQEKLEDKPAHSPI